MKPKLLLAAIFFLLTGYSCFAATPTIASFSPSSGQVGTLVTITGTNLATPTAFTIGGTTALVISNTGTQLVGFVMPGATTGPISLTSAGGTVNSSANFTVTPTATTPMGPQYQNLEGDGFLFGSQTVSQGTAVSVSADGNTAVVGTAGSGGGGEVGEAFVWARSAPYGPPGPPIWTQQGTPLSTSAQGYELTGFVLTSVGVGEEAREGYAAAISGDGNTVILGGPGNSVSGTVLDGTGSVWIFTRSGTSWAQQGSFLYGTGAAYGTAQGTAVALSADGNTAIVGGPYDGVSNTTQTGAVWIFVRSNGVWTQQGAKLVGSGSIGNSYQGLNVAISADGNTAIVGGLGDNSTNGAVWVFTRSGTTWTQQGPKLVGTGAVGEAEQGSSVALSADGNTAVVGGRFDNGEVGASWVFTRTGGVWTQQGSKLLATSANANQGNSVALSADGNTALIGGATYNNNAGAIWEFTRNAGIWTLLGQPSNNTVYGNDFGYVGQSLAISADGTTAFAGAGSGGGDGNTGGAIVLTAQTPSAITLPATAITTTGATLNGTVDGDGPATTVTMQYGTSPTLAGATTATLTTGTSPIPAITATTTFASVLTGLIPGTTYYFSITGVSTYGTTQGSILSFTTVAVPPTITISPTVTGSILACAGAPSASPFIQQFTVSGSFLTAGITATAPAAFQVSLAAGGGYGNSITIPQTAGTAGNTVVYVRSAAASSGLISGNIILSSAGAATVNEAVSGTINALPTANTVANQTLSENTATAPVTFAGTGNSFTWTNDTPTIGLAASGSGNIPSFTALNTGSTPVTATITVTPVNAGFAYIDNTNNFTISPVNTQNDVVAPTIPTGRVPFGVSVSPDGSKVYVANLISGNVTVISTLTNQATATIPMTNANPCGIVVSPDGSEVYTANESESTVSVINTATNAVTATINVGTSPLGIAVSPDGTRVYTANQNANTVSVINTQTEVVIATITAGMGSTGVAISPDGTLLYVTNQYSNTVSVINTQTNAVVATITVGIAPYGVTVSPDGAHVYVSNNTSNNVSVINTATNAVTSTIPVGQQPVGVSVSSDGTLLYVVNSGSNNVSIINTATNTIVNTVTVGSEPWAFGNFVSPNGCSGGPVKFTITVNPVVLPQPVITFPALASEIYGSADVTPGATSTNTATSITYASTNTAVATITAAGNVHIIGVGTTQITASQAASSTYGAPMSISETFTVTPAPLVITASSPTAVYGAVIPAVSITYNAFVNGDTQASLTTQPTISTTAIAGSGVGNYPTTASGAVDPNYSITYVAGNLSITPAPLLITPNSQTIAEGSAIPALTATYATFVNGDTQASLTTQATITTTATSGSAPGQYPITASGAVDPNYTITYAAGTLTIGAGAPIATTMAATSITASGATLNGTVNDNGAGTTVTIQYSTDPALATAVSTATLTTGTSPIAAGTGTVAFTSVLTGLAPATTYYFRISGTNSAATTNGSILSFTTAPPVVITFAPPGYVVYGSTTVPVISSTDPSSPIYYRIGNTAVASVTAANDFLATGVGTTYILAYQYAPGTTTIEATAQQNIMVNPAPLTIAAADVTIPWGQPAPAFTATYTGFVNGDTQASLPPGALPVFSTPYSTGSAAGNYNIFSSPNAISNGGNYNITYATSTLTVTPVYPQPTASTDPATSINSTGATINGMADDNGAATTVTLQYTDDDGDGLQDLITATLTTGPGTLPAGSGNTNYAAILTGLQPGTTYYFIITASNPEFSATGNVLTFTTPAVLGQVITFTAPASAVYGSADLTPNGTSSNSNIPITYTSSNTAVATITSGGNIHIVSAGTTTITASQAAGSGFTAATPVSLTFTVNPAPLTVTAGSTTAVYGAGIPAIAVTYSGFVNGDTQSTLATAASGSTTAIGDSGAGNYPTTASGASDPNYTITYVAGNLSITPAALTITANNQSMTTGAAVPALTVSYTGFVNDDGAGNLATQPTVTTTATSSSVAGTYPITVSGAVDPNYTITYVAGVLTVNGPFVFNPLPAKIYGDADFSPGAMGTNVTYSSGSTSIAVILDGGNIHIVGAGTSVITATSNGVSLQQTLTVSPAALTITAADVARVYNAANPDFTFNYTGFVYSDNAASLTAAPVGTTTATTTSDVGSYPITVSGASDPNYTITYVGGTLTINKAPQTIGFTTIPDQTINGKYDLSPVNASSGLPVSFALTDPTIAMISGSTLTSLQVGTETLTASQAGDDNYLPAANVSQTFNIIDDSGNDIIVNQVVSPNGDGIDDILNIKNIENYPKNKLALVNRDGIMIYQASGYNNTTTAFDGHSNITGALQQQGTLLYILEYWANGQYHRKTGFTVLRY